jgi:uncharacterized RDD family membrane protein YckC
MSTPAPGWYPDPNPAAPAAFLRWWDGGRWTGHVQPEGAAALAVPPRGPTTADGQPLAGWWWRALAYLVDTVVLAVVGYLATLPVQLDLQRASMDTQVRLQERMERGLPVSPGDFWAPLAGVYADHVLALVVVPGALGLAYFGGFLRWRGATPGKLMCGLRVRRRSEDGQLPWGTIAARVGAQLGPAWLAVALAAATGSFTAFLLAQLASFAYSTVDALTAAGAQRRSIHDRVAGTVVVATR